MNRAEYNIHKVISLRNITATVFVLRFERKGLVFSAGQHINVGIHGSGYTREYSVYSGVDEPFLEILVKEVIDGWVSPKLRELKEGDDLMVEAALGYFGLADVPGDLAWLLPEGARPYWRGRLVDAVYEFGP